MNDHIFDLRKRGLRPYAVLLGQKQQAELLGELQKIMGEEPIDFEAAKDRVFGVPVKLMGQPNLLAVTYRLL